VHASIKELNQLKRYRFFTPFWILFGGVLCFVGAVLALRQDEILSIDDHSLIFIAGLVNIFMAVFFRKSEDDFAQKYDMTHLLDIDDTQERFEAYVQHLSEWIATDMEEINPIRTRGEDPSGPDWGKTDYEMGKEPQRRDAIVEGQKYHGMEDDLTMTEKMVEEANLDYAVYAQKRWEKSEAKDEDLIEYGVERLGDLVRTDYFEKNAEEGIFEKTTKKGEEPH